MIFKKAKSKYSKQSWQPHQDNSYPKNKNGHYITTNVFLNKSTKRTEHCMFGRDHIKVEYLTSILKKVMKVIIDMKHCKTKKNLILKL